MVACDCFDLAGPYAFLDSQSIENTESCEPPPAPEDVVKWGIVSGAMKKSRRNPYDLGPGDLLFSETATWMI